MYDAAPIRADRAAGLTITDIARARGMSRTTVYAVLSPDRAETYHRPGPLDEWDEPIREVLRRWPFMAATDVQHRLKYSGPHRAFSERVRRARQEVLRDRRPSGVPGRRARADLA